MHRSISGPFHSVDMIVSCFLFRMVFYSLFACDLASSGLLSVEFSFSFLLLFLLNSQGGQGPRRKGDFEASNILMLAVVVKRAGEKALIGAV